MVRSYKEEIGDFSATVMHNNYNLCSPERTPTYSSYVNTTAPWRNNDVAGPMVVPPPPQPWMDQTTMPSNSGRWNMRSNEIDPGMNGDGWQGQGGPQQPPGGRGHHMGGGGGRRGGGMHQRMQGGGGGVPQQQHRMMTPNNSYRQQGGGAGNGGAFMPDMMALNIMQMGDLSLNGGPQVLPQQGSGMYGDMPPQASWPQPQPFAPQDDLYDHAPPFVQPPTHNGAPPFGNNRNGGYNNRGGNRQGGGYRPPQGFPMSMGMGQPMGHPPHMMMSQQGGRGGGGGNSGQNGGYFQPQQHQQQYSQPFNSGGPMGGPHDPMGGSGGHGGFPMSGSMDDYSMWTDENDEETKKKKILKDKGLNVWGDAETSNAKPIRRWLIPEGHEEDIETAMARCPQYLRKKTVHEDAIRRRLASDNAQVVAQAQQQLDEERNAMTKVGRRPIIACGWGDLPPELAEKSLDFDHGSGSGGGGSSMSKVWSDDGNGVGKEMPWNLPGTAPPNQPPQSLQQHQGLETRNPFFAQHMQQQHQHSSGGIFTVDSVTGSGDGVWSNGDAQLVPVGHQTNEPLDENRMKVAENLRYAVEKGHLDIGLLSLTHIPPTVLDLLTIILTKIPILDAVQEELDALAQSARPPEFSPTDDPKLWLNETQTAEYNKMVINVVTAKIEVTDLSKKINQALVNAGIVAPSASNQTVSSVVAGVSSASASGVPNDGQSLQNRGNDTFENAPLPDNCDFYDYSFLG